MIESGGEVEGESNHSPATVYPKLRVRVYTLRTRVRRRGELRLVELAYKRTTCVW